MISPYTTFDNSSAKNKTTLTESASYKQTSISGDRMSACSHERTLAASQSGCTVAHRDAGGGSRSQHQILTLALPKEVEHWSLTTLPEMLYKIGAKVVRHGRYVTFQLAEVAVPRNLFREILRRIDELRRRPAPA